VPGTGDARPPIPGESARRKSHDGRNRALIRGWDARRAALKRLFTFNYDGSDIQLTNEWQGVDLREGDRLAALRRWAREDAAKKAAS